MSGESLLAALKWQLDAGADEAIGEAPVDRFQDQPPAQEAAAPPAAPAAAKAEPRPAPAPAIAALPGTMAGDAAAIAAEAETLEDIRARLETFEGCPLRQTATNLVYYDGSPDAEIVFVGEAPGAEEDRRGLPFVGPAGRLLDRMLQAIGLDRAQVLITNTLFWRPPGNRNPTPGEVAACLPFVERTIEIVAPKVLVMVGGTAAKTLLQRSEGIMKLRGQWFDYQTPRMARPVPAIAVFHPAFLLRSPAQKRATWRDLIEIKARLRDRG
ncbi:MAG: uracil-DNA glycosylase [Alphaproteobacteria bacterium]|nr:uracil-DNA glycosylase [Alphaproteobacteria bacterium]